MLQEISVKNLAIIEDLTIRFFIGLNILSGETGAGKSILVGAIGLVMGARASTEMIRGQRDKAKVQALFDISQNEKIKEILRDNDIDIDGELIVRRVIARSGKNRVYLNGALVPLSFLKELGEKLVNIYGQHESQGLVRSETHMDILDAYGGLEKDREKVKGAFLRCSGNLRNLTNLEKRAKEGAEREDYLKFKINEIEKGEIKKGELDDLKAQRKKLKGAAQLAQTARQVLDICYESGNNIVGMVDGVALQVAKMEEYDPSFAHVQEQLSQISITAEELGRFCRQYLGTINHDPDALEKTDDRIHVIQGVLKKYGQGETGLFDSLEKAKKELAEIEVIDGFIEKAKKELEISLKALLVEGNKLEDKRVKAGRRMSKEIVAELGDLGIKGAKFHVNFIPQDGVGLAADGVFIDEHGISRPEFMLSANVGEAPRPLAKIASGGELSRILLAIKNAISRHFPVPTLVFDEVDAGIGGKQAQMVGRKLSEVARMHQVLCITHLPQIAAKADKHFLVHKKVLKGRAQTNINILNMDNRINETARMLSGDKITTATITAAKEMMDSKEN